MTAVATVVEQPDAAQCQEDAERRLPRDALLEKERHERCDHDRVDEENRAGEAGGHVVETLEEAERREGHQKAHDGQREQLSALDLQVVAACEEQHPDDKNGKEVAEQ